MLPDLPNSKRTIYATNNICCKQHINTNNIYIQLRNCILDRNIITLLHQINNAPVILYFDGNIENLNRLFRQLSFPIITNHVEIQLRDVNINKNSILELDNLRSNVKINAVNVGLRDSTELNTWCLNLSDKDFKIVYDKFKNKKLAMKLAEERNLAKSVYLNLSQKVDFSKMTATQKMNFMFDWVAKNTKYAHEFTGTDGNWKNGIALEQGYDPCQVFKNRKGVCSGRSRLLKVLLNNPYMKVDCYTTTGEIVGPTGKTLAHEWNEFFDEKGNVYAYDISYGIKHVNDITENNYGHHNIKHNHIINSLLNTEQAISTPPALPPRLNTEQAISTPPALPPRNEIKNKKKSLTLLPPRRKY